MSARLWNVRRLDYITGSFLFMFSSLLLFETTCIVYSPYCWGPTFDFKLECGMGAKYHWAGKVL